MTVSIPAAVESPAVEAGLPVTLGEAHDQIRDLNRQLCDLTTTHDTLRANIRSEFRELVDFHRVRPRYADQFLTKFGMEKLPRRFIVGAEVPVTLVLCSPDDDYAERGARRLILDDTRNLRDAQLRARTGRAVLGPATDAIDIEVVLPIDQDDTSRRPRFEVEATIQVAVEVTSSRVNTVWSAARPRLLADLARLRLIHVDTKAISKLWTYDVATGSWLDADQ